MPESKNPQSLVTPAAPVVIKQSSGRAISVVALVISLIALGAGGFVFVQGQNLLKSQELDFNNKIDKAALGESQNASLLQENLTKQAQTQAALDQLAAAQKQNAEGLAAANRGYQELLKGRADWLVDEVETMLNLAEQQLILTGNVPVAINVLENIETRLSRFNQPELLPIKQAVSNDLGALKNREYIDVSGVALRLDRLETTLSGLPLMVDGTLQPGNTAAAPATAPAANLPWWQDAWQKTLATLKGMVEVRRLENNDAMLIAPDQVYFMRENLRLRLLDARTALLKNNGEVYLNDLNMIETAAKQYFDTESPATQSWLQELAALKALDLQAVSDDVLKNSLNAVRHYQDSVRPNRTVALPEAASEPVTSASDSAASAPSAASAASAPAAQASAPNGAPATASEPTPVAPTSPSTLRPKTEEESNAAKPTTVPRESKPASSPAATVKGERA
ncbi:uroporphyrinogen-III C-methyltransferase [Neisseria montereyensis]|uniref:Uroporphyrinogen-III C-methyltransferase n=1 Tax=Neisseria montereyensis TaxID=2973938 RepID=A0ABT2FBP9_9NEIS|nr:uroporphyrinogen-III C-methyltransferase [Neisseria montereyensis]MCS4533622.1 uroporphyrinogen-III C-methyltransferase [Neisseria montereyensis]